MISSCLWRTSSVQTETDVSQRPHFPVSAADFHFLPIRRLQAHKNHLCRRHRLSRTSGRNASSARESVRWAKLFAFFRLRFMCRRRRQISDLSFSLRLAVCSSHASWCLVYFLCHGRPPDMLPVKDLWRRLRQFGRLFIDLAAFC